MQDLILNYFNLKSQLTQAGRLLTADSESRAGISICSKRDLLSRLIQKKKDFI